MTNTHKHSQTDHQARRSYDTHTNPVSGTNKTQSPSTHRRPEKTQTKEGDRPPDQTRPPDPQRRPTDPPESALTSNCRSISGLELAGAAEVGVCAGCDGGRGGSRPSPPPHGHARCSRRGRTRLRDRERPPAQLQGGSALSKLGVVGEFASFSGDFLAWMTSNSWVQSRVSAPAIVREASIHQFSRRENRSGFIRM